MPREITHWHILELSFERSSADCSAIAKVFQQHPQAAYLGAIAHDAPYYHKWGASPFGEVASSLHGAYAEDTFVPLRALAARICEEPAEKRPLLWAFYLGMLTHHVADIHFHPLVYYFTGNYNDPKRSRRRRARRRHRLFEVYLDSWCRHRKSLKTRLSQWWMLRQLGEGLNAIISVLEDTLVPERMPTIKDKIPETLSIVGCWRESFATTAKAQMLFLSPIMGAIVRLLNKISGGSFRATDALFTFGRNYPAKVFDEALEYKNPYTGQPEHNSVDSLIEDSVLEIVELFRLCEPLISGDSQSADSILGAVQGRSLNIGVYRVSEQQATHYSPSGLDLDGLRI